MVVIVLLAVARCSRIKSGIEDKAALSAHEEAQVAALNIESIRPILEKDILKNWNVLSLQKQLHVRPKADRACSAVGDHESGFRP